MKSNKVFFTYHHSSEMSVNVSERVVMGILVKREKINSKPLKKGKKTGVIYKINTCISIYVHTLAISLHKKGRGSQRQDKKNV